MIRKMTENDLDRVLEIEEQCFYSNWNYQQYLYELNENPYSNLYVYLQDDKIVGYFDLWIIFERAEIATIAVDPIYQGKHIGKKMMDYLQNLAIENGCETISLEVRVSNERAKNLYQSCGFIFVNIKPAYYQTKDGFEDGLFLMKGI
ncbi:MAG: ribosomal protein S18-alanine N-acetyltransferase [Erysipelotrichaceae bacterium]